MSRSLCCSSISMGDRSLPSPLSEDPRPGSTPAQFWPSPRLSPHLGTSACSFSHSVPLPQLRSRCPAVSCCLLLSYTGSILQTATRNFPDPNCNTSQLPAFAMTSVTPSSLSLNASSSLSSPSGPPTYWALAPLLPPLAPQDSGPVPTPQGGPLKSAL